MVTQSGNAPSASAAGSKQRKPHPLPAPTVQQRNIEQLSQSIPALQRRLFHASLSKTYCDQHPRQFSTQINSQDPACLSANSSANSPGVGGGGDAKRGCDCVNQRVTRFMTEIYPSTTQFYKQRQQGSGRQQQQSSNRKSTAAAGGGGASRGGKHVEFTSANSSNATGQTKLDEIAQILQQENDEIRKQIEIYEEKLKIVYKQLLE